VDFFEYPHLKPFLEYKLFFNNQVVAKRSLL